MNRASTWAAVICSTLLTASLVPLASGQSADDALARTLTGTWTLAISREQAQARIETGIAAAVAGMPPIVDGVAAGRLRERTPISPQIVIAVSATEIRAQFVHATFTSAPGASVRVPVPGAAGETMEMVQVLRDGRLDQVFTTEEGRRWSSITPNEDGTRMTLSAVIHSERLTTDVRFSLPYRRAP